jgi:hypothetical protein
MAWHGAVTEFVVQFDLSLFLLVSIASGYHQVELAGVEHDCV